MFDWLFEGRLAAHVLLGGLAGLLLLLWYRDRKRAWLFGAAACGLLLGLYVLLDRLVETGREQITRKLGEMAVAVGRKDPGAIFAHIDERFRLGDLDKPGFRRGVEKLLQQGSVDDLRVWAVEVPALGTGPARVVLQAKPTGRLTGDSAFYRVECDFVAGQDGQWRLRGFQVFNPLVNADQPIPIPSFLP